MLPIAPVTILKLSGEEASEQPDLLAVEEPLEIRLGFGPPDERQQRSLSVTMRTPGHDEDLALGFLLTEGIIYAPSQLLSLKHCTDAGRTEAGNIIRAELRPDVPVDWIRLQRNFYTSSSCGVCGKASIEAVYAVACPVLPTPEPWLSADLLGRLPAQLRQHQAVFAHTGGLHAAALFDQTGKIVLLREDVGRHNALDKLLGAAARHGWWSLHRYGLLLSGRISFELVQKSLAAGLPALVAMGAPSSLAVQLAESVGQTLVGFLREGRMNVYSGAGRVVVYLNQNLQDY